MYIDGIRAAETDMRYVDAAGCSALVLGGPLRGTSGGWRGELAACSGFTVALPEADVATLYRLGAAFALPGGGKNIAPRHPELSDALWDNAGFFVHPSVASDAAHPFPPSSHAEVILTRI